jgi:mannose-1-phosphate guanylyltransferase / phosphomannomutase
MKAVIMAGGKGTRLRPLTSRLPKPMVPLLNKPCMEYIIELLKRYGITDIAVTVQYLPQVIQSHFGDGSDYGVNLHYFEESSPLGTAGSVKNAESFLDDTFIVISGDALTDFNLEKAMAFHREKQALATLVMTRVEVPLEYGVVMTDATGKIIRFLEKPSWSEVFSDTVNTGIYVLEPEVLSLFDRGEVFDFSKDLFPKMLDQGLPLYGYEAEGYWSDIGNLTQYRKTQLDMLDGCVNVRIPGTEIQPGVWIGRDCSLDTEAEYTAPVMIGDGTVIQPGAKVGPYAILGRHNRVGSGAEILHSVVWNRTCIGEAASLSGTTVTQDVRIGTGARLAEESVVGANSRIGEMAWLRSGVKLWPEKRVAPSAVLSSSLVWEQGAEAELFGSDGISGLINMDLTPEKAGKIAAAFASLFKKGSVIAVTTDGDEFGRILRYAVTASLLAAGHHVRDGGEMPAPVARFTVLHLSCDAGIHLRRSSVAGEEKVVMQFFDHQGLPIDKGWERKVENAFLQEEALRPAEGGYGFLEQVNGMMEAYRREVLREVDVAVIREHGIKVVLYAADSRVFSVVQPLLGELGCRVVTVIGGNGQLSQEVKDNRADLGIAIDGSAQSFTLFTETGRSVTEAETVMLQTLLAVSRQQQVPVPVTAPSALEEWLEQSGIQTLRTKGNQRAILSPGSRRGAQIFFDACSTLAALLAYSTSRKQTLQQIIEALPLAHMQTERVACPVEAKGRVMRRLMEEMKGRRLELIDGIKVLMENGWALILPDDAKAYFQVVAEGKTAEAAHALVEMYKEKILLHQR